MIWLVLGVWLLLGLLAQQLLDGMLVAEFGVHHSDHDVMERLLAGLFFLLGPVALVSVSVICLIERDSRRHFPRFGFIERRRAARRRLLAALAQ